MPAPAKKRLLARLLDLLQVHRLLIARQAAAGPYIRAVNYHAIPPTRAAEFERHLQYYQRHFEPVDHEALLAFAERGEWPHRRPGLILSFDDGLRDNAEVAAPLLERYGFRGWFFIPTAFLDTEASEQPAWADAHQICDLFPGEPLQGQAMDWEQLASLADRGHMVGAHTVNHTRLKAELGEEQLREEIAGSRARLEQRLGRGVPIFCWVGGEEWSYSAQAARAIRQAGFRVAFMTNSAPILPGCELLQLQRTNIETDWELPVVRFQLSGLVDRQYAAKRERVNALTATSNQDADGRPAGI